MNRRALAISISACVVTICVSRPALATSVQPPVWSGNGANVGISWTSETATGSGFVTFDDFSYASTTNVNEVTWWGIFLNSDLTNGSQNTSRWDILIEDNTGPGGTPHNLIGGQLNAPVQGTNVGTGFFGVNQVTVYEFTAEFPNFTAQGGQTYWIAPVSVGQNGNFFPFFSWIQGTNGDGTSFQVQLNNFNPIATFTRDGDRAFELASVPEPATLTLLGTGLLAVARRRLRARRG